MNITKQYASFKDDLVVLEYDYNSANLRVSKVRCINNSLSETVLLEVSQQHQLVWTDTCPPNTTNQYNVPQFNLTYDSVEDTVGIDGYELKTTFPYTE